MKTVVLFSRCELVHLYGRISKYLSNKVNVIHVAYSDTEAAILKNNYAIANVITFSHEVAAIHQREVLDTALCEQMDNLIIEQSSGRFNLNGAIQSDRTYQGLEYNSVLILCQTYYKFWLNLIEKENIDFLLHEPTSLFFNQISALICNKYSAKYITQILGYGQERYNFMVVSGDDCRFDELINKDVTVQISREERESVKLYLNEFRGNFNTFVDILNNNRSFTALLRQTAKGVIKSVLNFTKLRTNSFEPLDHIDLYHLTNFKLLPDLQRNWGQYFLSSYDEYDESLSYFYYPMHLEPEAVVLYWGDGIYNNQVKLIENIASQLPANVYLLVKDHPHAGAYRSMGDYDKIRSIPNVKLINPGVQGKKIIANSKGIITINGTSGFEALLLNKQVYVFGNSFYDSCKRVNKIRNIRDFRSFVYQNQNTDYVDDDELIVFVHNYLKSTHKGFTGYFINHVELADINEQENAEIVSKGLISYFESC